MSSEAMEEDGRRCSSGRRREPVRQSTTGGASAPPDRQLRVQLTLTGASIDWDWLDPY